MKKTGQPYANWKDDGKYDAIVIGSGIGGLGVPALLAKHADKRVLVLEDEDSVGIMLMSCMDAFFTLQLMAQGAVELNYLMAYLIEDNHSIFIQLKVSLTAL